MVSWAGFWGDNQGVSGSYELLSGRSPNRYHLARMFKKRGMRELSEIIRTVNGVTVGQAASSVIRRKQAVANTLANVQGGVQVIESFEQVGLVLDSDKDDASANTARNTAAADTTAIASFLADGDRSIRAPTNGSATISYPVDLSGNGGGGKQS